MLHLCLGGKGVGVEALRCTERMGEGRGEGRMIEGKMEGDRERGRGRETAETSCVALKGSLNFLKTQLSLRSTMVLAPRGSDGGRGLHPRDAGGKPAYVSLHIHAVPRPLSSPMALPKSQMSVLPPSQLAGHRGRGGSGGHVEASRGGNPRRNTSG